MPPPTQQTHQQQQLQSGRHQLKQSNRLHSSIAAERTHSPATDNVTSDDENNMNEKSKSKQWQ